MAASKQESSAMATGSLQISDREIFHSRVYDAPRELIWQMWTVPERVSKWWGPRGYTTTTSKMDVRPGGLWEHMMRGPDGREYPNRIVYLEVVKPERIVYSHESYPPFRTTITFEDQGEKTKVSMRMTFETADLRNKIAKDFGAVEGLQQTMGRLDEFLPNAPLVIERAYQASIDTVWKAVTELSQMQKWFMGEINAFKAEKGFETVFAVRHQGKDFPHIWKVLEVVPGRKISVEWKFGGYSGASVATMELFEEKDGTRLRLTHEGIGNYPKESTDLSKENFAMGWNALVHQQLADHLREVQAIKTLILTREYESPREVVFKGWTDPKRVAKWWGPRGFTNPVCELDARVDGKIRIDMRGPEGTVYPMTGRFDEVVEPQRLVFTCWAHCNPAGDPQLEVINAVTFTEHNGKTKMSLRAFVMKATAQAAGPLAGMEQGWTESLLRFAEFLISAAGAKQ